MHRLSFTMSSAFNRSPPSGILPLILMKTLLILSQLIDCDLKQIYRNLKQISNILLPILDCTSSIVSRSCLAIACPRSESTLKLLVRAGNIKNATTVTSLRVDCNHIL